MIGPVCMIARVGEKGPGCRWRRIGWRRDAASTSVTPAPRPPIAGRGARLGHGRPRPAARPRPRRAAAARRRPLAGLPRVLRAAGRELLDLDRAVTNAVYGFTSMLINVLRDEQPTHVAVAFDVSRQTFRSEEYAEYKANRSRLPAGVPGQVALIKEVLDALRIPVVEKEGYEADDVIATLDHARRAARAMDVLIMHRRPRRVPARHRPRHGALPAARGVASCRG